VRSRLVIGQLLHFAQYPLFCRPRWTRVLGPVVVWSQILALSVGLWICTVRSLRGNSGHGKSIGVRDPA